MSASIASSTAAQDLAGRVVLITGGSRGLGAAIADVLGSAGARVVIGDIESARGAERAAELTRRDIDAMALPLDVGDDEQARGAMQQVRQRFGRLDALINNAGIDFTAPVAELSITQWERVLRTNLTGPFVMVKHALPLMQRGAHIVNIASTAAKRAWPNASAYHATKWGLLGLSHALHAELRPQGIKVSAVVAGGMRTPFLLDRFPDIDSGTLQDPMDVARAVRFVLSQPDGTVIPEVMVLPMRETSWP
jgi:NAD(P)-dependent dehydrogenase (short-subunit alcohol dehydrogenase family)